jgi:cobalt-zinc-cadmium efflux system membrane fusion protein
MKTLLKIIMALTLPIWLGGCGGGDSHGHDHGAHGHGGHEDEEAPTEVTFSAAVVAQHKIEVANVERHTLRPTFSVPARVAFNAETIAHVGTLVKGRVSDLKARLGDTVKKGGVLFTIESTELGAAQNGFLQALDAAAAALPAIALAENDPGMAKAEAEMKAAEAMLALAQNPATINKAKADIDAAAATVELAKNSKAINKAKADLDAASAMVELAKNSKAINKAKADLDAASAMVELSRKSKVVAQAQGKLDAAKPVLLRAKQLFESGKKLEEDGAIAAAELKRRETAMQSAAAEVFAAQATVQQAEAQQQRDLKAATAGEQAAQAGLQQAGAQQQRDFKAAAAGEQAAQAGLQQAGAQQQRDLKAAAAAHQAAAAGLAQAVANQQRDIVAAKGKLTAATAAAKAAKSQTEKVRIEAKSGLSAAQSAVSTAQNQLTLFGMSAEAITALAKNRKLSPNCIVTAPRAGTVVEREVTLGETVSPAQPHLLILADLTQVWVLMEVPPSRARAVKTGQSVTLLNQDSGEKTLAKLAYISPVVDPKTRTIQARVELGNPDGDWRPGQFLTALLPTGEPVTEQLTVPVEAVQIVDGQPTVYVRVKDEKGAQTFKPQAVTVGEPVDGWRAVTTGLKGGEAVVVKNSYLLKAEFGKAGAGHDHSH